MFVKHHSPPLTRQCPGQGHKVIEVDIWKNLVQGMCTPDMNSLSYIGQQWQTILKFVDRRKVKERSGRQTVRRTDGETYRRTDGVQDRQSGRRTDLKH